MYIIWNEFGMKNSIRRSTFCQHQNICLSIYFHQKHYQWQTLLPENKATDHRLINLNPQKCDLFHPCYIHQSSTGGTHLYTWVEKRTMRVTSLTKEHYATSLAGARTRTAWSRDERITVTVKPPLLPTSCQVNRKLQSLIVWMFLLA